VSGYWLLSVAALVGSQLVSYAKARAAMEVRVSNQEWPDLMERTERSLLYLTGLVAGEVLPWRPFGRDLFWWTLAAITVLVHATVVQRVWRARGFILARGGR
jgi:phosphatidylglycerophosphate synthase